MEMIYREFFESCEKIFKARAEERPEFSKSLSRRRRTEVVEEIRSFLREFDYNASTVDVAVVVSKIQFCTEKLSPRDVVALDEQFESGFFEACKRLPEGRMEAINLLGVIHDLASRRNGSSELFTDAFYNFCWQGKKKTRHEIVELGAETTRGVSIFRSRAILWPLTASVLCFFFVPWVETTAVDVKGGSLRQKEFLGFKPIYQSAPKPKAQKDDGPVSVINRKPIYNVSALMVIWVVWFIWCWRKGYYKRTSTPKIEPSETD